MNNLNSTQVSHGIAYVDEGITVQMFFFYAVCEDFLTFKQNV